MPTIGCRKRSVFKLALMTASVSNLALGIPLAAQVSGSAVAQHLKKNKSDYNKIDQYSDHLHGTLDEQIVNTLLIGAFNYQRAAENDLDALEYTSAEELLEYSDEEIGDANEIISEDARVPWDTLHIESSENKYLDGVAENVPSDLSNRKKRALIYSEYSLTSRMFQKAKAHGCPLLRFPSDPVAKRDVEVSGIYMIDDKPWDAYLKNAMAKFYTLQYDESHKMMYVAYREAQDLLTNCGVAP